MEHTKKIWLCSSYCNIGEKESEYMKLFCVMFVINCIMIGALTATLFYWKSQVIVLTASEHDQKRPHYCLKCEEISVHPHDDNNLLNYFDKEDNGTNCCVTDASHLKRLVDQFLERKYRIAKAKAENDIPSCQLYENGRKPAGRVVGVEHDRTGIDDDERQVLHWLNTKDGSYQIPGIAFIDGQLEFTTSGYYWFNSRVTFRDSDSTSANDRFAFFHTIYRRSAEYPLREDRKLVEAAKTQCKLQFGFADRSSYIGDIAYFKKGERIIVKVSHPEMISVNPYESFLEVHLY